MTVLARLGLAIVRPRWALAVAGDRRHAGRSGSDLMLALLAFLIATHLRFLVEAAWAGIAVDPGLGLRMLLQTMTGSLTVPLGFLVIAAAILWLSAGPRRDLGRAFDLACVAVLPFVAIDLGGRAVAFALRVDVPRLAVVILTGAAFAWSGTLVALAALGSTAKEPPPDAGRRAGFALVGLVALGLLGQGLWIAAHGDLLRPMQDGDPAPVFALPRVTADGALGPPVALESLAGKVVVLDFWATWCGPCLQSMPRLDAFAKQHPDVAVLAINTDDPHEARAIFRDKHYALELLADTDGVTSRRYRVETIPHTVVIDRRGFVRAILHGGGHDLAEVVEKIQK